MTSPASALASHSTTLGYGHDAMTSNVSLTIPEGKITAIIGPNACGKSTLLRGFARLLKPTAGHFELRERSLDALSSRVIARELAILPQESLAPPGILVRDLVTRGRYPHQSFLAQASKADHEAIDWALRVVGIADLAHRPVNELSGGQRQRVWIAMILAQDTDLLLLDEPTTYLDLAHQIELLDLVTHLNHAYNRTIVVVLHDLNQAARYADHLVVMRAGTVVTTGTPHEVMTADLVESVFGVPCRVMTDPESHTPLVIPKAPARGQAVQSK